MFWPQLDEDLVSYLKLEGVTLLVRPLLHMLGSFLQVRLGYICCLLPFSGEVLSLRVFFCIRMINNMGEGRLLSIYNFEGALSCRRTRLTIETELSDI